MSQLGIALLIWAFLLPACVLLAKWLADRT